jgi:hypothetical protein
MPPFTAGIASGLFVFRIELAGRAKVFQDFLHERRILFVA